jgi:hypothetical protein
MRKLFWTASRGAQKLITARNDIAFRYGFAKTPMNSAHAEAEDRN